MTTTKCNSQILYPVILVVYFGALPQSEERGINQHVLSHQSVSSVTQSCPTLYDPMDCSMPGLLVHHQLPEVTQTLSHQAFKTLKKAILSTSSFHSILLNMSIPFHFFSYLMQFQASISKHPPFGGPRRT